MPFGTVPRFAIDFCFDMGLFYFCLATVRFSAVAGGLQFDPARPARSNMADTNQLASEQEEPEPYTLTDSQLTQAILAERERCLRHAISRGLTVREIAEAIRSGK